MKAFSALINSIYLTQVTKSCYTLLMMVTHGCYALLFQFHVCLSIIHKQDLYLIRPGVFHLLFSFPIFFFLLLSKFCICTIRRDSLCSPSLFDLLSSISLAFPLSFLKKSYRWFSHFYISTVKLLIR